MRSFHERALLEQWNSVPLTREVIERLEESMPGVVVSTRVNGVDRKDLLVMGVRQNRARVQANVIGAQWHVAAKARRLEILIGEVEIGAQSAQPLRTGEGPE